MAAPLNNGRLFFVERGVLQLSMELGIHTTKRHTAGGYDKTLTYGYDNNGNITSVSDGANAISYVNDVANQLVRENNQAANLTWTWAYDAGGNIRERKEYAYTMGSLGTALSSKTYGYDDPNGWGDLLTAYNGTEITYDGIGNPLTDGTWTYTWEGGRNLTGLSKTGTNITYAYNDDGVRTSKTVDGVTTTYTLVDGRVTHETNGTDSIYYRYDSNGNLISMNLNGTEYYYFRNAQNDIFGLFDNAGNVVVEYTYDAWGSLQSTTGTLATTVGVKNPYRYRGYRYDTESGLYYLQSRYYNPEWERFINSDDISALDGDSELISGNLFAYCANDPVNNADDSGYKKLPNWAKVAIGAVALTAAIALTVATGGAAAPLLIGVAVSTLSSAAIGGAVGYVTGGKEGLKQGVIDGAADGFMWGGIGALASSAVGAVKAGQAAKGIAQGACFIAGTLVAAKDGMKPIQDIKVGELVYSENSETGEKGLKRVVQTFINETNELVHVFANGDEIVTTPEHPFYVPQKGWTRAIHLRAGDVLVLNNGKYVIVEKTQHEILEKSTHARLRGRMQLMPQIS